MPFKQNALGISLKILHFFEFSLVLYTKSSCINQIILKYAENLQYTVFEY